MTDPSNGLRIYQIYDRPADYPRHFVVRGFTIVRGQLEPVPDAEPWSVCADLAEARRSLPAGVGARLSRDPSDPPSIVESWV